jgi:hypothetical protein
MSAFPFPCFKLRSFSDNKNSIKFIPPRDVVCFLAYSCHCVSWVVYIALNIQAKHSLLIAKNVLRKNVFLTLKMHNRSQNYLITFHGPKGLNESAFGVWVITNKQLLSGIKITGCYVVNTKGKSIQIYMYLYIVFFALMSESSELAKLQAFVIFWECENHH